MATWLIVTLVVLASLGAVLVWCLCRSAAWADRQIEAEARGWPLVRIGHQPEAESGYRHPGVPGSQSPFSARGPDCRGLLHGDGI